MALSSYNFATSTNPFTAIRASAPFQDRGFFAGRDPTGFAFVVADAAFYELEVFIRNNAAYPTFSSAVVAASSPTTLRAIINAQYFDCLDRTWCQATSRDVTRWEAIGERIIGGTVSMPWAEPWECVPGDTLSHRYFGKWSGRSEKAYAAGLGYPSAVSPRMDQALGGLLPIILRGIPFGDRVKVDANGVVTQHYCPVLSATFLIEASVMGTPEEIGKVIFGIHRQSQLVFFIAQEEGAHPGIRMSNLITLLDAFGVDDALTGDGGNSSTLAVDGTLEVTPTGGFWDPHIVSGFGLRPNTLMTTSTAADASINFYGCTIPTLTAKLGTTLPVRKSGAAATLAWTSVGLSLEVTSFGTGLTAADLDISSLPITLPALGTANDVVTGVNFQDSGMRVTLSNLKLVVTGGTDPGTLTGTLTIIGAAGTTAAQGDISWKLA